ncbi:glycosyltransferase [Lutimaribacter marinistellae]|uniref:Glycosyltransferase n=1 Tax=Lutimaribacter marinistellae TaxID=1820329 RepID=A0ABV7TL50_9RHOB
MPAPISIVIPTLDAGQGLGRCLEALMEGLPLGLIREVIVSDGGSTDNTLLIADEAGADVVSGPASRGGQLRRGCGAARGEWVMIVHADTILMPGWAEVVREHVESSRQGAYFRLAFRAPGLMPRLVAGWANARAGLLSLPFGDQGLLLPRVMYEKSGGYPDQPLMEDVALVRSLPRLVGLPVVAMTGADRYLRQGWMRRGARNLWTQARYFAGTDPERLAEGYRR